MGKQKTVWPTDREIRLRFMLFAVIDTASIQGVPAEILLTAHTLLRNNPTQAQLREALADILDDEHMEGFRFPIGSDADELMRALGEEDC